MSDTRLSQCRIVLYFCHNNNKRYRLIYGIDWEVTTASKHSYWQLSRRTQTRTQSNWGGFLLQNVFSFFFSIIWEYRRSCTQRKDRSIHLCLQLSCRQLYCHFWHLMLLTRATASITQCIMSRCQRTACVQIKHASSSDKSAAIDASGIRTGPLI